MSTKELKEGDRVKFSRGGLFRMTKSSAPKYANLRGRFLGWVDHSGNPHQSLSRVTDLVWFLKARVQWDKNEMGVGTTLESASNIWPAEPPDFKKGDWVRLTPEAVGHVTTDHGRSFQTMLGLFQEWVDRDHPDHPDNTQGREFPDPNKVYAKVQWGGPLATTKGNRGFSLVIPDDIRRANTPEQLPPPEYWDRSLRYSKEEA